MFSPGSTIFLLNLVIDVKPELLSLLLEDKSYISYKVTAGSVSN